MHTTAEPMSLHYSMQSVNNLVIILFGVENFWALKNLIINVVGH